MVLFINLVTDDFPAMGLSLDSAEKNVMQKRPRKPTEPLIDAHAIKSVLFAGIIMTFATFGVFVAYYSYFGESLVKSQTLAFASLMVMEIMYAYVIRMPEDLKKWQSIFRNGSLNATVALASIAALSVIHIPGLQSIFSTTTIHGYEWLVVFASSAIVVMALAFINHTRGKIRENEISSIKNKVAFG